MSSRVISYGNYWWRCPGLNGGPAAYESAALPTELHRHGQVYCILAKAASIEWASIVPAVPGNVPANFCGAALRSVGLTI